jgi:sec-independent protein translocase protein TatA
MFENLSVAHVLMVIAIALLIFGPKRIPEIAGSFGKGIREFKKSISDATRDEPPQLTPGPTAFRATERHAEDVGTPSGADRGELADRDRSEPKRLLN